MYPELLSQPCFLHPKKAITLVIVIFGLFIFVDASVITTNHSRPNLREYSINGGEDGNTSRCRLSYYNSDPLELTKFRDASGKLGSGIYNGNRAWFGSFSECKKLPESRYCLVIFDALVILNKQWTKTSQLKYGVCAPKVCSKDDIKNVLGFILKNISMIPVKPVPDQLRKSIFCAVDPGYTTGVVLTIVLCGVFIFLCLLATIFELIKDYKEQDKSTLEKSDEFSMAKTNEKTPLLHGNEKSDIPEIEHPSKVTLYKVLHCFSIIRNTTFIFNTNVGKTDLTYLHGIRVLSLFWIILFHFTTIITSPTGIPFADTFTENNNDVIRFIKRRSVMVLINGALAVDTFFLLSGLLVVYVNLKKMERNNGQMNWVKFFFHRFWRLTPSYMFAILFLTKLQPFFGDGPLWYKMLDTSACSDYWWTNLLYINNFHPKHITEACLTPTWYLSADMQFFVFSPILIITVLRFGFKPFLTFASVLILASIITIASLVGDKNLSPVPGLEWKTMESHVAHFNKDVYSKPYCRIQPYIVGMVLGYIILKHLGGKIRLKWYWAVFSWCLAISTSLAIVYAPHNTMKDNPREWSKGEKVIFGSLRWFLFSMSVGWVIFACEYGYAGLVKNIVSAKFWIPLSRINYAAFILHVSVINTIVYNIESPLHFDTFTYVNYYLSSVVLSYACAFIFTVVVELPFANFESLMLKK